MAWVAVLVGIGPVPDFVDAVEDNVEDCRCVDVCALTFCCDDPARCIVADSESAG